MQQIAISKESESIRPLIEPTKDSPISRIVFRVGQKTYYPLRLRIKSRTWVTTRRLPINAFQKITQYLKSKDMPIGISTWRKLNGSYVSVLRLTDMHPLTEQIYLLSDDEESYPLELNERKHFIAEVMSKEETSPLRNKIGYGRSMMIDISKIPDREYEHIIEVQNKQLEAKAKKDSNKKQSTPNKPKQKADYVILE